jgi:tetratricopeptide (TPR) repeat protein
MVVMRSLRFALIVLIGAVSFDALSQSGVDSTGLKLIEDRKFAEAKVFFEAAVGANPKDPEAHYQLARVLFFERNSDDAEDQVDEALKLNDNVALYHFLRGQILGERARDANVFKQAILAPKIKNEFLRSVELDPALIEGHIGLYNYYIMAPGVMGGSDEEALKQAGEVERLDPVRGHLLKANYHQRKNELDQAEEEFRKAISAAPEKIVGYKSLGYFYVRQEKYEPAIVQFKKYVELDPRNPDAYDSYGDALFAQGKIDEAIEKYSFALSLDKNFSSSIYQLGACYEKKGLKAKAIETYQWYLTVDPSGRYSESAHKKIKELS